jgi:hypothetical protein
MTLRLNGSTSGYTEIDAPAVAGSNTLVLPTGAGSAYQVVRNGATAGSLEFTDNIVSGTAVASTSGTSIDFTGIPSWVKRVTVMFSGVSTSGTSNWQIQVGTSAGIFTSSTYVGAVSNQAGTTANNSNGFQVSNTVLAADVMWGQATLLKTGSNAYQVQCTGILANSSAANTRTFGGAVTPPDIIDRVRITTVNGTDTFDAGSINILME